MIITTRSWHVPRSRICEDSSQRLLQGCSRPKIPDHMMVCLAWDFIGLETIFRMFLTGIFLDKSK